MEFRVTRVSLRGIRRRQRVYLRCEAGLRRVPGLALPSRLLGVRTVTACKGVRRKGNTL